MNFIIVLGVVFVVLLIIILLFRKIKALLVAACLALVLIVGVTVYAIVVPSSQISIWFTQNIAAHMVMDPEDTYTDGNVIWQTKCTKASEHNITFSTDLSESLDALKEFVIARAIDISDDNMPYTLTFKDSYLQIENINNNISIIIVKGVKNDTN